MPKPKINIPDKRYWVILSILIAFAVYKGVGNYGYVNWDDDENIRQNIKFTEWNIENLSYHFHVNHYKSLAIFSYMAEYKLFEATPKTYHNNNLILHLLNIFLVFILIRKLFPKNKFTPLIVSVLFAVHPASVEVVSWITGRKDLLFVFFSIISLLVYRSFIFQTKTTKKILFYFLLCATSYLASLAKIQALALPFTYILLHWFLGNKITYKTLLYNILILFLLVEFYGLFIMALIIIPIIIFFPKIMEFLTKSKIRIGITLAINTLFWSVIYSKLLFGFIVYNNVIMSKLTTKAGYTVWFFVIISTLLILFWRKVYNFTLSKNNKQWKIYGLGAIFIFICSLILLFINYSALYKLSYFWQIDRNSELYYSFSERIMLMSTSFIYYVKRFFLLIGQNPMIAYPERINGKLPVEIWRNFVAFLFLITIASVVIFKYFKNNRSIWFGALFFFINISLVLHIIPIEGRILVADRYTYFAYIGLFILIALLIEYLLNKRSKILTTSLLLSITLILSYTTYNDKYTWKNSFSLWQKALEKDAKNHYAMFSLALAYFEEESNPEMAEILLNKAIENSKNSIYYNNRGRVRYAMDSFQNALEDFNRAIEIDSNSYASYNNRGATKLHFGNLQGALVDYEKALEIEENYKEAFNNKIKLLEIMQLDSIIQGYSKDINFNSTELSEYILFMSENFIKTKQEDKAVEYLKRGVKILPDNPELYEKLATIYHLNKKFDLANDVYNLAIEKFSINSLLLLGRGLLYIEIGDTAKACNDLEAAAINGNTDAQELLNEFCQ